MLAQAVTPNSRHLIIVTALEVARTIQLWNIKHVLFSSQLVFSAVQKAFATAQTRGNSSTASHGGLSQQERVNLLVLLGWKK